MNFKLSLFRFNQHNQIRWISRRNKPKNHYDSLGIPSTSTQGEVKSAYYKLSMIYHPDKSQTTESAQKFRDITEAYEVLGNTKTRKLYDRGLYVGGISSTSTRTAPEDPHSRFHRSREVRSRPPPPTGRTPIYDFDEWSKNHYGTIFRKQMANRQRLRAEKLEREESINQSKMETTLFGLGIFFIICAYIFKDKNDYDTVSYNFPLKPSTPNQKD